MDEFLIWLLGGLGLGLLLGWRTWRRRQHDAALRQAWAEAERAAAQADAQRLAEAEAEQRIAEQELAAERAAAEQAEAQRRAAARADAAREAAAAAAQAFRLDEERQAAEAAAAQARHRAELQAQDDQAAALALAQAQQAAAARAETERLAAAEAQRAAAAQVQAEHAAAAQREAERIAVARLAEQRALAQRVAAAEQAELERVAAVRVEAQPAAKRAEQTLVMVADDSKVVRVKTGRLLATHRYQVCYASDGLDAVQQLQAALPDVVITDVEMPGMDGFELTRHIRGNAATAHIPVIMITAADDRHREQAAQAGVSVLLGKPYPEDALIAHIRLAMGADANGLAAQAVGASENGALNALV